MTEIHLMTPGHALWDEIISLAETCSWRAGPFLAEKMKHNEFKGWERVCAACVDGKAAGFCTLAEKDELPEKYTFSPFIGFMFVDEPYRGKRLSELMIDKVCAYARELGYEKIYIMSGEIGLYEKYGFQKLGDYETIYGSVDQLFVKSL
ncbi:MAG: GNAT family N-acetyltransferase [Oscillospiraceae bacterium]|nr:GNAT family N-acetyltransferase [Oscillospiraceae bacterium]